LKEIVEHEDVAEGLKNVVLELVEKFKPLSIILAGSVARGRFVKGLSDVDLLVVVENVSDKERFHLRTAGPANVEITVVGLEELIRAATSGNEFYRQCVEEGVEVYGSLLEEIRGRIRSASTQLSSHSASASPWAPT